LSLFFRAAPLCAVVLWSAIACQPAWAQRTINRCTDANGRMVLSDRVCVSSGPAVSADAPPSDHAAEPPRRQSMACTRLGDAIRSAPLRGVRDAVLSELRSEYARACH
jgi:hypothetical protein